MKAVSSRTLHEIKEARRDAGRKFWRHIKAQQPTAASCPMFLHDSATGAEYRDEEGLRYLEDFMATKLRLWMPPGLTP